MTTEEMRKKLIELTEKRVQILKSLHEMDVLLTKTRLDCSHKKANGEFDYCGGSPNGIDRWCNGCECWVEF